MFRLGVAILFTFDIFALKKREIREALNEFST